AIRIFRKSHKKHWDDKKDIDEFGVNDRKNRPSAAEFHAKIAMLPLRQAQAINLVFLENYSEAEAALIMGCTPPAMRKRIERAKKNLREKYGDDYE
ncbi:MAG: sigma-70 region 4 domain-containing protein, partial [Bacilli bacterium]|nr:sigma-70 region 4 domain-containing protein [Bacilli bacterium]